MVTRNQYTKKIVRVKKLHKTKTPALLGNPQKLGIVIKIGIVKPKKPNSAQRKVAWVKLKHRKVIAYIPGQGHNISKHSHVWIRGGRIPDLPGVRCRLMRGQGDFLVSERFERCNRRSKYAKKNPNKKESF